MDIIPQCLFCKHYKNGAKCSAFPKGIPDPIFTSGTHDHKKPFKGDNGIRFEAVKK